MQASNADLCGIGRLVEANGRVCCRSDRQGRGSTIVTSQVDVKHWHEMIVNPTVADAILDRLVHNAHRLNLAGDSLRKGAAKRVGLDENRAA